MTIVAACICDDGKVVVMSDAAIGFGDGYRRIMSEGKWWDMGCLVIGECGDDFALSRIRRKTQTHKNWEKLRDPFTFSALVCEVQEEVKGEDKTEPIEAELLHIATNEEGKPTIHVIGGDGGISGPFPYMAIGDPHAMAMLGLNILLKSNRMKRKTTIKVANVMREVLENVILLSESVSEPLHTHIFDPNRESYKEL